MNASIYVSMPLCIYIYIYYINIYYIYMCVCNSSAMYLLCLCGFHFSAFQAIHFPALQATNPPTSMINLWILGVTGYPLKVDTTPLSHVHSLGSLSAANWKVRTRGKRSVAIFSKPAGRNGSLKHKMSDSELLPTGKLDWCLVLSKEWRNDP